MHDRSDGSHSDIPDKEGHLDRLRDDGQTDVHMRRCAMETEFSTPEVSYSELPDDKPNVILRFVCSVLWIILLLTMVTVGIVINAKTELDQSMHDNVEACVARYFAYLISCNTLQVIQLSMMLNMVTDMHRFQRLSCREVGLVSLN